SCPRDPPVDPGFQAQRAKFLPDKLLIRALGAYPEHWSRLKTREQFEAFRLGRPSAGRKRQVLAHPAGHEPPRVPIDWSALDPSLEAFGPRGPARRVSHGCQSAGVATYGTAPDAADWVHGWSVEEPREKEPLLERGELERPDPPVPAEEGHYASGNES